MFTLFVQSNIKIDKIKEEQYMTKVNFYDTIDDSLLKFAVIIPDITASGYFASTRKEIHGRFREDIGKRARIFLKQLKESYRRKQEQ